MVKNYSVAALALCFLLSATACKNPQERAQDKKEDAIKAVDDARQNVRDTEAKAAKDMAGADTRKELNEKKIDATTDIAKSQETLRVQKNESGKEIASAEATAASVYTPANH